MTRSVAGLHVLVDSVALAEAALGGGAAVIQVRTKAGTDRDRLALAVAVVERCRAAGAGCVVNDRVDLALAAGADGVHLGADDIAVERARAVAGPALLIGGTARDPAAARRLVADGADYLGVGPVWATVSKVGLPAPIGLAMLRAVATAVDVPVVAIAGITAARVADVLRAGAAGVAVIGAVTGAADPEAATRELVRAFDHEPAR
ncbi:MAG: thiamine phosphate synthase [Acidimicrobiales bacterium]